MSVYNGNLSPEELKLESTIKEMNELYSNRLTEENLLLMKIGLKIKLSLVEPIVETQFTNEDSKNFESLVQRSLLRKDNSSLYLTVSGRDYFIQKTRAYASYFVDYNLS